MILTVTANPAFDVTYRVTELTPGSSHRTAAPLARAGGKGVNVARVAQSQGFESLALFTSGGDTGARFVEDLRGGQLAFRAVPVAAETRRSIAIVSDSGEATLLNETGTALTGEETERVLAAVRDAAATARVIAISGSMPPGEAVLERLIEAARSSTDPAHSPAIIVDTSGPALLAAAAAGAHVLKPNHIELAEATGITDPIAGARHLIDLGASLIVVSRGEDGMVAVSRSGPTVSARLPRVLSGNPTGAGDAAVAAIAATLTTQSLAEVSAAPEPMLRQAVAWSAAAVLMPLAGSISDEHAALAAEVAITH